ncbi:MAG: hypothetical protein M1826_005385 [Phylliscum demangeonii]|nr:MAG: hypothetical protein M1826_005385 [Phylliscum demangeonii]
MSIFCVQRLQAPQHGYSDEVERSPADEELIAHEIAKIDADIAQGNPRWTDIDSADALVSWFTCLLDATQAKFKQSPAGGRGIMEQYMLGHPFPRTKWAMQRMDKKCRKVARDEINSKPRESPTQALRDTDAARARAKADEDARIAAKQAAKLAEEEAQKTQEDGTLHFAEGQVGKFETFLKHSAAPVPKSLHLPALEHSMSRFAKTALRAEGAFKAQAAYQEEGSMAKFALEHGG